jgi:hypothetical protein
MSTVRIFRRLNSFENKDIIGVGMGQFPAVCDICLFLADLPSLSVAEIMHRPNRLLLVCAGTGFYYICNSQSSRSLQFTCLV